MSLSRLIFDGLQYYYTIQAIFVLLSITHYKVAGFASRMTSSSSNSFPSVTKQITLISYNIDGLNPANLEFRTRTAASLILSYDPDVIQLQEVVHSTAPILISAFKTHNYVPCHGFDRNSGMGDICHYFTMSFCKDKYCGPNERPNECNLSPSTNGPTLSVERCDYRGRANSDQGRDILRLKFRYCSLHFLFVNCHLESCGTAFKSTGSAIRMAQMEESLRCIVDHDGPAVMAGDLNIRVPEAVAVTGLFPPGALKDVAEVIEGSKMTQTWFMPDKPSVKARYDRIYCNNKSGIEPVSYQVIGGDSIYGPGEAVDMNGDSLPYNTPSDHRGLLVRFSIQLPAEADIALEEQSKSKIDSNLQAEGVLELPLQVGRKRTRKASNIKDGQVKASDDVDESISHMMRSDSGVIDLTSDSPTGKNNPRNRISTAHEDHVESKEERRQKFLSAEEMRQISQPDEVNQKLF